MNLFDSFGDEDKTYNKEENYIFGDKIDINNEETVFFNIGKTENINEDKDETFSLQNNQRF